MSKQQFWQECDDEEYQIYQETYYERIHESSHIQGQYFYIAMSSIISQFNKKESDKIEYPKENLFVKAKEEKPRITISDIKKMDKNSREEYRKYKLMQCY